MNYRDERESSVGAGTIIVILLTVLGVGLLGVIVVGGLFVFSVRATRTESHSAATRVEDEAAHEAAQVARMHLEEAAAFRNSAEVAGLTVNVNAAGQYALAGEAKTADELEAILIPFARDNPGAAFVIRTEQDAPLEPVIKLLEIGKRVGIANYQLTTEGKP